MARHLFADRGDAFADEQARSSAWLRIVACPLRSEAEDACCTSGKHGSRAFGSQRAVLANVGALWSGVRDTCAHVRALSVMHWPAPFFYLQTTPLCDGST